MVVSCYAIRFLIIGCHEYDFMHSFLMQCQYLQVYGDYSEDVGVKLERPTDETMAEGEAEVVGA